MAVVLNVVHNESVTFEVLSVTQRGPHEQATKSERKKTGQVEGLDEGEGVSGKASMDDG